MLSVKTAFVPPLLERGERRESAEERLGFPSLRLLEPQSWCEVTISLLEGANPSPPSPAAAGLGAGPRGLWVFLAACGLRCTPAS